MRTDEFGAKTFGQDGDGFFLYMADCCRYVLSATIGHLIQFLIEACVQLLEPSSLVYLSSVPDTEFGTSDGRLPKAMW